MRKSIVAAWLALSSIVAAVPAAADGPVSVPLAPGEVLLELSPTGVVISPATSATMTVGIYVEGSSEEEARRFADSTLAQVRAAARAVGIADADIVTDVSEGVSDVLMNASYSDLNAVGAQMAYAGASAVIRIRNPALAPALQRRLNRLPHVRGATPEYRLDDDGAARRAARGEALRRARSDADAYAASMNLRVARVLRVTERLPADSVGMSTVLSWGEAEARQPADGEVRTVAALGVDYALAPR